ncbi:MAG: hypothetical protein WC651_02375 [Candidatus Gracilibacteria bacterium]|jgi:hypothetical protein
MDIQNVPTPEVATTVVQEAPKSKLGLFAVIGAVLVAAIAGGVYYFGFMNSSNPPQLGAGPGQGFQGMTVAGAADRGFLTYTQADVDNHAKVKAEKEKSGKAKELNSWSHPADKRANLSYFWADKDITLTKAYEEIVPQLDGEVLIAKYDPTKSTFVTTENKIWKKVTDINPGTTLSAGQATITMFIGTNKLSAYSEIKSASEFPEKDVDVLKLANTSKGWHLFSMPKKQVVELRKTINVSSIWALDATTGDFKKLDLSTVKESDITTSIVWLEFLATPAKLTVKPIADHEYLLDKKCDVANATSCNLIVNFNDKTSETYAITKPAELSMAVDKGYGVAPNKDEKDNYIHVWAGLPTAGVSGKMEFNWETKVFETSVYNKETNLWDLYPVTSEVKPPTITITKKTVADTTKDTVTLSKDTAASASVEQGATAVSFAKFDLTPKQDGTIKSITLDRGEVGSASDLILISIFSGKDELAKQAITSGSKFPLTIEIKDGKPLTKGKVSTIEVRADISATAVEKNAHFIKLTGLVLSYSTTDTKPENLPLSGNTMTIAAKAAVADLTKDHVYELSENNTILKVTFNDKSILTYAIVYPGGKKIGMWSETSKDKTDNYLHVSDMTGTTSGVSGKMEFNKTDKTKFDTSTYNNEQNFWASYKVEVKDLIITITEIAPANTDNPDHIYNLSSDGKKLTMIFNDDQLYSVVYTIITPDDKTIGMWSETSKDKTDNYIHVSDMTGGLSNVSGKMEFNKTDKTDFEYFSYNSETNFWASYDVKMDEKAKTITIAAKTPAGSTKIDDTLTLTPTWGNEKVSIGLNAKITTPADESKFTGYKVTYGSGADRLLDKTAEVSSKAPTSGKVSLLKANPTDTYYSIIAITSLTNGKEYTVGVEMLYTAGNTSKTGKVTMPSGKPAAAAPLADHVYTLSANGSELTVKFNTGKETKYKIETSSNIGLSTEKNGEDEYVVVIDLLSNAAGYMEFNKDNQGTLEATKQYPDFPKNVWDTYKAKLDGETIKITAKEIASKPTPEVEITENEQFYITVNYNLAEVEKYVVNYKLVTRQNLSTDAFESANWGNTVSRDVVTIYPKIRDIVGEGTPGYAEIYEISVQSVFKDGTTSTESGKIKVEVINNGTTTEIKEASLSSGYASLFDEVLDSLFNLFR